ANPLAQGRSALLEQFCASACSAFLGSYRLAARTLREGGEVDGDLAEKASIVSHHANDDLLLDLALFEKAAYEVCYEAAHRPEWLGIPLAGLVRVSRRMLATSGAAPSEDAV